MFLLQVSLMRTIWAQSGGESACHVLHVMYCFVNFCKVLATFQALCSLHNFSVTLVNVLFLLAVRQMIDQDR